MLAGSRWTVGPTRFVDPIRIITATEPDRVRSALDEVETAARSGLWAVGFVSYEAASGFDENLRTLAGASVPLVWFGVYQDADRSEYSPRGSTFVLGEWRAGMSAEAHSDRVAAIRESIRAGDTYQVNLTFPMSATMEGDSVGLFEAMLDAQPASFGAHIDLGDVSVLSVAPELFLQVSGRDVVAEPMKGTAPRGRWAEEDLDQATRLVASAKERAGNVMIVDLIRNDLGRIAEIGSVEVPQLFSVESHPTVWQLTSTVTATLADEVSLADLFTACFPSGSVTGAPKASTMGIIAAHEDVPRGVYCGAIGYLAPGGESSEFSVAIRTGVVSDGAFNYHVGGGITYDSLAGSEYDECLWKALVVTQPSRLPDLIETMRFEPESGIPLLDRHISRLMTSAAYWGIECDLEAVGGALSGVRSGEPVKVRLLLGHDGSVDVEVEPIPQEPEPVPLRLSGARVDPTSPLWYHKTRERSHYPTPRNGGEEILVNLDGDVTETNQSNLMVRLKGEWLTPPIESGCLPGVYRGLLIDEKKVRPERLTVDDLTGADELAVTNAVRGWRKATLIE